VSVRLRMKRFGRANRPFWRLVAADKASARDGRVIEELGHYDPLAADTIKFQIHRDRVVHWLKLGADPSLSVAQLLAHQGLDKKGNEIPPKPWKKVVPPELAAKRLAAAKKKAEEAAKPKAEEKPKAAEKPKAEEKAKAAEKPKAEEKPKEA
jgi:small subunit ribosomal protein S16